MENDCIYSTYETEHLELKLSDPVFAEAVADYYRRNKAFLEPWEPVRSADFFTAAYQRSFLEEDVDDFIEGTHARFWIFIKGTQKIIGCVALNNMVMGPFCSSFLSYKLDGAYINQGLMAEAIAKVSEVAFGPLELHRLEANIMPRNGASLSVVEKLGFVNEGISKKYLKIGSVWEDHIHMVLLNEDR